LRRRPADLRRSDRSSERRASTASPREETRPASTRFDRSNLTSRRGSAAVVALRRSRPAQGETSLRPCRTACTSGKGRPHRTSTVPRHDDGGGRGVVPSGTSCGAVIGSTSLPDGRPPAGRPVEPVEPVHVCGCLSALGRRNGASATAGADVRGREPQTAQVLGAVGFSQDCGARVSTLTSTVPSRTIPPTHAEPDDRSIWAHMGMATTTLTLPRRAASKVVVLRAVLYVVPVVRMRVF
jgi:hypothetical protein